MEGEKLQILKTYFGYDSFRPGQEEIIDQILAGRDALAIMPTGAGKSLCYQVPALMMRGITIVISPLISLMMDQVKALNQAGISAAFINSALSEKAFFETVKKARQGLYKIIYVAPERLLTDGFLNLAKELLENPETGIDLGHGIHKVRMAIKSKGKGKSGGARVITVIIALSQTEKQIGLHFIYDKSERENISDKELQEILKQNGL